MIRNVLRLFGVGLIVILIGSWYYTDGLVGVAGFLAFLLLLVTAIALGVGTVAKLRRNRGVASDDG